MMETIVPGILLKDNHNKGQKRKKAKSVTISKKRATLENYLSEGYGPKKAMELAGYSPKTIMGDSARVLRSVNWDAVRLRLKDRSIHANHMAIAVAMRQMQHGDAKQQGWGAKLALDNAKIHLADDKSPTNITFSFQTIGEKVQINVGKPTEAIEDGSVKEIEDK